MKTDIQPLIPALRFPGFYRSLENLELSKITSYVDYRGRGPNKTENGIFLVTAKNIKKGFIDYDCSKEYIKESDYGNVMSKGTPIIGDVLFTTEAPLGNVAQVDDANIALAQRVIKFRGKEKIHNGYILFYMLSTVFQKTILKKAIGTTVQGISGRELHKIKISFPSLPEQQKIASFLTIIDSRIQALEKRKSSLEKYKKGVMQKIFTQEIRLKDIDGKDFPEWEEKKLGEVAKFSKGRGLSKNDIDENGINDCIRYGELYTDYCETIASVKSRTNLKKQDCVLSEINDVIIPASGETHLDIATASCVLVEGVILGGDLNIIKSNLNGVYLAYLLNSKLKNQVARLSQGSSVVHLYSKQLCKLNIIYPSQTEQTHIANFLTAIDKKIALVNEQIEKTKTYKKGLLQKMFV